MIWLLVGFPVAFNRWFWVRHENGPGATRALLHCSNLSAPNTLLSRENPVREPLDPVAPPFKARGIPGTGIFSDLLRFRIFDQFLLVMKIILDLGEFYEALDGWGV